jgi:hypothetical protein
MSEFSNESPQAGPTVGTARVKRGMAEMLKGGVIMDVVTAEQAKIAEDAGAVAVMALERVPADIRAQGGGYPCWPAYGSGLSKLGWSLPGVVTSRDHARPRVRTPPATRTRRIASSRVSRGSPAAFGQAVRLRDLVDVDADHGLAQAP